MPQVFLSSVRLADTDSRGASLVMIGERDTFMYEGTSEECANWLASQPVGISVLVKHSRGQRSCMNKPALWADCRDYA